jgi:hypothetical protein
LGVGHPPARVVGGTLSHGELRVLSVPLGFPAMPRTRAQQEEGEWADLPDELLAMVLEAAWRSATQAGGLGFSNASVRLVCAQWQAVHDAMVRRLVLRRQTTDEAMGMLVLRFPAVVSLEFKYEWRGQALTDEGLRAVSCLPALTSLDLSCCFKVTDVGMRAVSSLPLTSLNLNSCRAVTDVGLRALSCLPALTFLDLSCCFKVTDEGLRALSSLPALTFLGLSMCHKVTAAGVQALRNSTAAPSLHIQFWQ